MGLLHLTPERNFCTLLFQACDPMMTKEANLSRRKSASGRTTNGDGNKRPQSSDGKKFNSSDQEDIIALFRRIQSSISKGDSESSNKRSSNLQKEKPSSESILDVLRESGKELKAKAKTSNRVGPKALTKKRVVSRKEKEVQNNPPVTDLKLTRPPSNFVKKSPIPSLSTPRGKVLNHEASSAIMGRKEVHLQRVEEMKLSELKELAKCRGIRGYSKLKKSELVELLRS
ncbi:Rho termination factor, putative isoform 1 [Quillaja saponaria]|uniref:Rho termination factor, putative isoform 1 n=1 Tax=Quillaja saponaria TaxID=32244 RepID=A0AAD7P983_QUISA|nr:Rho termination factor, putative isoform 1 [Quillaja saponaria]